MIKQSTGWAVKYIEKNGVENYIEKIKEDYEELEKDFEKYKENHEDWLRFTKREMKKEVIKSNTLLYKDTETFLLELYANDNLEIIPIKTFQEFENGIKYVRGDTFDTVFVTNDNPEKLKSTYRYRVRGIHKEIKLLWKAQNNEDEKKE
jgi:hypothetical protein